MTSPLGHYLFYKHCMIHITTKYRPIYKRFGDSAQCVILKRILMAHHRISADGPAHWGNGKGRVVGGTFGLVVQLVATLTAWFVYVH